MKYTQDSRDVEKGDVFVALVGEKTDGHKYIGDALKKGASKIVFHNEDCLEQIPEKK